MELRREPATSGAGAQVASPRSFLPLRLSRASAAERRWVLLAGDLLLLGLTAIGTMQLSTSLGQVLPEYLARSYAWLAILGASWVLMAAVVGGYDIGVAMQAPRALRSVARASGLVAVGYLVMFYILGRPLADIEASRAGIALPLSPYAPPRVTPSVFLIASTLLLALWRVAGARALTSAALSRRALVVGAGLGGRSLVRELGVLPNPYRLVGFLDDDPAKAGQRYEGLEVCCSREGLLEKVEREGVEEIILATRQPLHPDLLRELMKCHERDVAIRPMSTVIEELGGRVPVEYLGQKWFLASFWNELGMPTFQAIGKRALDLLVSAFGLCLFALLAAPLALAIKLDSRGPIFFVQRRVGRGGRPFRMVKLRSMVVGAERPGEAVWASESDHRVTRVGRFLRRSRFDELPQLWNVLLGHMSIVGPRPEREELIALLEREIPFYRMRLTVKPGLTGWAQINFRYGDSVRDALSKLEYDLYYVKNQSLLLDVLIILRTIGVVVGLRGR
jgi:exopolysaccharide biosynthesis polyprenyl glycosylphosphotransferase